MSTMLLGGILCCSLVFMVMVEETTQTNPMETKSSPLTSLFSTTNNLSKTTPKPTSATSTKTTQNTTPTSTRTTPTTTTSTTATTTPTTTIIPGLGKNCTESCTPLKTSCRKNGTCHCKDNYFQFNKTCFNVSDLNITNLKVSEVGEKYLSLTWSLSAWDPPDSFPELSYIVYYDSKNTSSVRKNGYNLTDLTPGHLYTIYVRTSVVAEKISQDSITVLATTIPSQVEVKVPEKEVNASNFILIFQHQEGEAEYYNITVKDVDQNIVYSEQLPNASKVCVEIENLQSASTYMGEITTLSHDQESKPVNFSFTTPDATSGAISNFKILNTTNTSVRIAWSKPMEPRGIITGYLLEVDMGTKNCSVTFCQDCSNMREMRYNYCSEDHHENEIKENETINYNVTGLPSFEKITFIIYAYNGAGQGEEYRNTTRTKIGVPSVPDNVSATAVNSSSVNVTWDQLAHKDGPTNFTVSVLEQSLEGNTDFQNLWSVIVEGFESTGVVIGGLQSYWKYKFSVVASTDAGSSKQKMSNVVTTLESVPPAPDNVSATAVNSSSVNVTWDQLAHKDGPTNFTVSVLEQSLEGNTDFQNLWSVIVEGFESTGVVIGGLQSYWKYKFSVVASTDAGSSKQKMSKVVTTLESVPPAPDNVSATAVNSSSVYVTWDQLAHKDGPTNFTVSVLEQSLEGNTDFQNLRSVIVEGFESTGVVIGGLQSYWKYKFSVVASTDAGSSKQKMSNVITTSESVPGNVTNLAIRDDNDTYTAVGVEFSCPALHDRHGVITHYSITYKTVISGKDENPCKITPIQNMTGITVPSDDNCTYSVVVPVSPETEYSFSVQAFDTEEGSIASIFHRTVHGLSGPVDNLGIAQNSTNTSITVTWSKPLFPNGNILAYRLQVTSNEICNSVVILKCRENMRNHITKDEKHCAMETQLLTDELQDRKSKNPYVYEVQNLLSYTSYTVSVAVINSVGLGKEENVTSQTKIGVPSKPTNFSAVVMSSSEISLFWTPSEHKAGPTNYTIQIKGGDMCTNDTDNVTTLTVTGFLITRKKVSNLVSYTNYTVSIASVTSAGQSGFVQLDRSVRTKEAVPTQPTNIQVRVENSSAVNITWTPPCHQSGPTNYNVNIFEATHRRNSEFVWKNNIFVQGYSKKTVTVTNLLSSWEYKFDVVATTSAGSSNSTETANAIRTSESTPSAVSNLQVFSISGNYTAVRLTWNCSDETARNGFIKNYTVKYSGPDATPLTYGNYSDEDPCNETHTVILPVRPENNYSFTVFPNAMYRGLGASKHFYAKPGEPLELKSTEVFSSMPSENTEISTDSSFVVSIVSHILRDSTNGKVRIAGLIVTKGNNQAVTGPKNVSDMKTWKTWREWKDQNYIGSYRPTPDNWLMTGKRRKRSVSTGSDNTYFTVGGDRNCENKQECNGPLPSDTTFSVVSVACTVAGCTATQPYGPFKTKPKSVVGAAVGGTFGAIIVIGVLIGAVLFRRRRAGKDRGYRRDRERDSDCEDEEAEQSVDKSMPRKIADFAVILQGLHKDSKLLFSKEWQQLSEATVKYPSQNAHLECNRGKNRYVNILAYDHTRVKLLPKDEEEGSDYINANYIIGYSKKREYIASQGPTDATIDDFWQMVWEQNVPIIVMLTGLQENGVRKLAQYWPEDVNAPRRYGDVVVELISYSPLNQYTISVFTLRVGDGPKRTLKHFFLQGWHDFNANLKVGDVIDFARYVRKELRPSDSGPMLVHCSAGVGRTGTYICLDYFIQVIDNMDTDGSVDIFSFVLKMRDCRPLMVQSEKQYVFIYDAVQEMIERKQRLLAGEDEEHVYQNQAFDPEEDAGNVYMNVDMSGAQRL